ncbi:MAG: hypothetical protein WCT03_11185 [Candidatus Obscuribacterales bacterium]|jgi:hypothetical protein
MTNLTSLLEIDPLTAPYRKHRQQIALDNLDDILIASSTNRIVPCLSTFVTKAPWTHWDKQLVVDVKNFLELSPGNSLQVISQSTNALERAFRVVLDKAWNEFPEAMIVLSDPAELKTFSQVILPAYLRLAEHAYVNFLRYLWLVSGKKEKGFNTSAALQRLPEEISSSLKNGYNDHFRNAIAHGEMHFGLFEIFFGPKNFSTSMDAPEALALIDDLWCTCNSINLGILAFLSDSLVATPEALSVLPPAALAFVLGGLRDRPHLAIETVLVHNLDDEQELNVYVTSKPMIENEAKHESLKIAQTAFELSGWRYDSVLVAFDTGISVPSQIRIKATEMQSALQADADGLDLNPIIPLALIWKPPRPLLAKWHLYKAMWAIQRDLPREKKHRLRVRKVENRSIRNQVRIQVSAVPDRQYRNLEASEFLKDVSILAREIAGQNYLTGSTFEGGFRFHRRPMYVWIDLYSEDRNLRQIAKGGWDGGNLLLKSELRQGLLARRIMPITSTKNVTIDDVNIQYR